MLKPLHMRYAQRINRANNWKGHFWQGRFFSSALDESYLWAAIRYAERRRALRLAGRCNIDRDAGLAPAIRWHRRLVRLACNG